MAPSILSAQFLERVEALSSPSELVFPSFAPGKSHLIAYDMPFEMSEISKAHRHALAGPVCRGFALRVPNSDSDDDRQNNLLEFAPVCAEEVRKMYAQTGAPVSVLCEVHERWWDNELSFFLMYFRYWCEEDGGTPI